jgi:hypothetical protein
MLGEDLARRGKQVRPVPRGIAAQRPVLRFGHASRVPIPGEEKRRVGRDQPVTQEESALRGKVEDARPERDLLNDGDSCLAPGASAVVSADEIGDPLPDHDRRGRRPRDGANGRIDVSATRTPVTPWTWPY